MRDSFIFYRSFFESAKDLPPKEKLKFYEAIFKLALDNEDSILTGFSKSLFLVVKPQLLANNMRYENGKKGGAKKGNVNALKKQPMVVFDEEKKTTEKQPNENVNENVNVNVNENENVYIPPFIPPKGENHEKNEKGDLELSQIIPNDEKEKEKSCAKKEKETRHKYGTYMNVLLTDEEYGKIISMPSGAAIIDFFSEMKEMKGYKYKRDYLAIKNWGIRAYEELSAKNQQPAGHYQRNSGGSDAEIKRRERENLSKMALAILSSPPS